VIKRMHYDFKMKFNKLDSQQNRNLKVPEIDWLLNEAYSLYVKLIAQPRVRNTLGFETSQRSIDDIRTIVVKGYCSSVIDNTGTLPDNYMHFVRGEVIMDKGVCKFVKARMILKQHDDRFEEDSFYNSSFEWREVNALFFNGGLRLHTDGTFVNKQFCIDYIRKLTYMHNAEDFGINGRYKLPSGELLTGTQDCELPSHTHAEIVDIAVMLAANNLQTPDYQSKLQKLNLNNII
jgi:hypothetical protein